MKAYQIYLTTIAALTIIASYLLGWTPLVLSLLCLIVSLISYGLYASDKKSAQKGDRRVPENTLHMFDLIGGWPGGLLAQYQFRHKTRKVSFRFVFWLTVLFNTGFFAYLHSNHGHLRLRYSMLQVQQFALSQTQSESVISWLFLLTEIPADKLYP